MASRILGSKWFYCVTVYLLQTAETFWKYKLVAVISYQISDTIQSMYLAFLSVEWPMVYWSGIVQGQQQLSHQQSACSTTLIISFVFFPGHSRELIFVSKDTGLVRYELSPSSLFIALMWVHAGDWCMKVTLEGANFDFDRLQCSLVPGIQPG